ncbi:MAG: pitrilysin family protein [Bacteroidota bacterium]|nr:pitrilysin family protein [Bacteroidota bacterium]MDP3145880.1 pitrilysin family protein [Bacteroidota bacterium]
MKKLIITVALITNCLVLVNAQKNIPIASSAPKTTIPTPTLIEEVKKVGNEIVITYKKYQLPNGLTILIHEDHSDPICYVDVTYHVGSAREQQGRSGFAHFFEHMMFQGSKNVADEQHFKIITEAGGTLNGSTNTDRTNYFETVPSNQLEKMLWLEADRMGFLLDSVTQKKFEVQRATVKNERGQRYDNAPYGLMSEKMGEALYPQGHPYSWTTIGYLVDLNRVDVNDLKRFYMRWYGPNNAVLTVAGDVNTNEVLQMAQKYFGSIEKGAEVKKQIVPPFKLEASRYVSYEDNVKFPQMNISYVTVPANHKDEAALDILGDILSGSQGSPMYKAFIESKKALNANAFHFTRELAGQFMFIIRTNPDVSLAETEKELKTVLDNWEKKGATDDDLIKYKAQFESSLYDRLNTVQGKGATLASYYTLTGNANYIKKEIAEVMAVTKADVMRVYTTYIKNKPAVYLSCLPKGKEDLRPQPDNWKMYDRIVEQESAEYKNLSFTEPKDNFNRAIVPTAKAAAPVPVPNFYTTKINNLIPVIGITDKEFPKINILISFKAGHLFEPKEKSGLAELMAKLLGQSTLKTSAEEVENKLARLGSSIDINSGQEDITISIESHKKNLLATLKIVEESLFEPKFDKEEFEIEKKGQLDQLMQLQSNAGALAEMAFKKILYGPDNVLGYLGKGTSETVSSITLEDIKDYYNTLNSSMVSVAVSGDINKEEIEKNLTFLSKLKSGDPANANISEIPKIEKTKIYFVDKKNAAQSEIRVGYIALPYDALGDYYKASIMNFSFAGAFNSRINYLLREIKGWSYGVRGGFSGTKYPGVYSISGGFKANTTDSTVVEIFKELKEYVANGIKDDEMLFTKNAISQADGLKYESPFQKLYFIKRVLDYDLSKDYVAKQTEILNSITSSEINALAKKYLPYNNMVIVIVGDKASNFEKVKKLGFDVVEIDSNGKTIN